VVTIGLNRDLRTWGLAPCRKAFGIVVPGVDVPSALVAQLLGVKTVIKVIKHTNQNQEYNSITVWFALELYESHDYKHI